MAITKIIPELADGIIDTIDALTKTDIGLGNADNTSDANKPISTATQTALDLKQPLDADLTAIAALTTTSFGRGFLDLADAAAGRTKLALASLGVGGAMAPYGIASPDLNTYAFESGEYYVGTVTNGPTDSPSTYAYLHVQFYDTSHCLQIFTETVTGHSWSRSKAAGVWGAWRRIFDQRNILGTVSQSSGIPTGAVIEAGNNGNGDFVKYADGTMVCYRVVLHAGLNFGTAHGSFFYAPGQTWTYPAVFAVSRIPPTVTAIMRTSGTLGYVTPSSTFGSFNGTNFVYHCVSPITGASDTTVLMSAVGRWF